LLAVSAMPNIDEVGFQRLNELIAVYDHESSDATELWNQRMAELDFHSVVAEYSDNALLAFICRFLQRLLKDLAVTREIYIQPQPLLRASGIAYQRDLLAAIKRKDAKRVHQIMRDHMAHAEAMMLSLQAEVESRFLDDRSQLPRAATRRGG